MDEHDAAALEQHLQECGECRAAYAEYLAASQRDAASRHRGARLLAWSPMEARRRRFIDAAAREGLRFSDDAIQADAVERVEPLDVPQQRAVSTSWRTAAAVLAAAVGGAGVWALLARDPAPDLGSTVTHLIRENDALRVELRQRPPDPPATAPMDAARELELQKMRDSVAASGARVAALEAQLGEATAKLAALQLEASRATADTAAIGARVRDTEQRVAALQAERDRLIEQRAADAGFMDLQAARIERLTEQVRDREQMLARQEELLGADRDIRDLMGARNLHVIDVFDVDSRGKTRKSFGRAFYTEGKSLIFYAFDLGGRGAAPTSFQAWGHRTADDRSQSLGILYSDDKAQNRWVLKFDDPKVLDQIDAVFVTVEPPGGSSRPSGNKLLYAYLRNNANHP